MRRIFFMAAIFVAALTLSSCHKEKKTENIIAHRIVKKVHKTVSKIGDETKNSDVNWVGNSYRVEVKRIADPSMPVVDDGTGNRFYDNRITVRVLRKDGSEFFSREFKKGDFMSSVHSDYAKKGALVAIIFDKAEGDNLLFAVTVGSPDSASEEYVPLTLKISRFGSVAISSEN